jgi:sec-independent protein translocase protein TatB
VSGNQLIVLLVVAAVVLGPERLPHYAQQLARLVRELRRMAAGAAEQAKAELGSDFDPQEWRKLDPRQYDPRRIIREALTDAVDVDDPLGLNGISGNGGNGGNGASAARPNAPSSPSAVRGGEPRAPGSPPPFDPDAT